MALITRTYTFTDGTTAYGSQVESEISNITTTLNNLGAGSSTWDIVSISNGSSVPLVANNAAGSNDIANFKANSVTTVAIKSTGITLSNSGQLLGSILTSYRRPVLQYSSGTVVNMESGLTGTSGQVAVLFPDGTYLTDTTTSHYNIDLSRVASATQSGLRTGAVANNTWYACYATKNGTSVIGIADTVLPLQANYATLNSNFGSNSWVYLGMIAYGDNSGTANAILSFQQTGNFTIFKNICAANGTQGIGIRLATNGSAANSVAWTYAAGTAIGSAQVPNHVNIGMIQASGNNTAGSQVMSLLDTSTNIRYVVTPTPAGGATFMCWTLAPLALGVTMNNATSSSNKHDIFLAGFWDGVLGVGSAPLL